MKTTLTMISALLILLMAACEKDDESPYSYDTQSSILYGSQQTSFKEILFYLKPYILVDNQKRYVATDTLFNITMKVNSTTWGIRPSLPIDTSAYHLNKWGQYYLSDYPVVYPVVAAYQTNKSIMNQAGHYADLLLNYQTLTPGDYLFRIESFEIKQANGSIRKYPTTISLPLTVANNQRSAYIGEFEVQLKP